jgi:hypothetical protein
MEYAKQTPEPTVGSSHTPQKPYAYLHHFRLPNTVIHSDKTAHDIVKTTNDSDKNTNDIVKTANEGVKTLNDSDKTINNSVKAGGGMNGAPVWGDT